MAPGTRIGPFKVERLIATGSTGAVYEATQVSLRRAVALRLIEAGHFKSPVELVRFDHQQRLTAALHHPNLVPYFEAGEWEGGRFIATRLVRGKSLTQLREEGSLPASRSLEPLVGALATAHDAELVHGRISEQNILVGSNGTPYLADLGLNAHGSGEEDVRALNAVISGLPDKEARPGNRRALWLGMAALTCVAGAALVLALGQGGGDTATAPQLEPPPVPANAVAAGSALAPATTSPLGCSDEPSPNTPACSIAQITLGDEATAVERAGVIRSWAVRGASGDLALQVIRQQAGKSFVAAFSQPERLEDPAPQAFDADIPVRPGDLIGVRLAPGATVGSLTSARGSALERWDGGLTADSAAPDGTLLDGELMLRADIEFGARPDDLGLLVGEKAASAPPGETLTETDVQISAERTASAVVVELPSGIAIDLVRGGTRLSRLEVPDADPEGELLGIYVSCGGAGARGFCLRWQNPDDDLALFHTYRASRNGQIKLIG